MKRQRQKVMLDIISNEIIETQEELQEALKQQGYVVTQATISRDMKELSLEKQLEQGIYRYVVVKPRGNFAQPLSNIMTEAVISVVAAQNIVVVKTLPGLAMAACTALDNMEITGNVGTLAGDDTFLLIMTNTEMAEQFAKEIEILLGTSQNM